MLVAKTSAESLAAGVPLAYQPASAMDPSHEHLAKRVPGVVQEWPVANARGEGRELDVIAARVGSRGVQEVCIEHPCIMTGIDRLSDGDTAAIE